MEIVKISVFLLLLTTWTWGNPWDYSEYSEFPEEIDDLNEGSRSNVQSMPRGGKPVPNPPRVTGKPNGAQGGNSGPSGCMTGPQIQQHKQKQRQQVEAAIKLLMQLQKQLQMQPQECRIPSPRPSPSQAPQRVQAGSSGGFNLHLGLNVGSRSASDGEDGDPPQTLDTSRESGVDSDEHSNQFSRISGAIWPEHRTEGDTYDYLSEQGRDERSYSWGNNEEGQVDNTASFSGHPEQINYISNPGHYGEW